MNALNSQKGVTLVELMVTVIVAATILGIGIPSFRNLIINNRMVSQANELIGIVTLARSEAIRRNSTVTLCRAGANDATACANTSETTAWDHWIIRTASGDIIQRGSFQRYNNTINISTTLTNGQIQFRADGLARTGSGSNSVPVSNHIFRICSTQLTSSSRHLVLGTGSRQSIVLTNAGC